MEPGTPRPRVAERVAHSFMVRYRTTQGPSRWLVTQLTDFSRTRAWFLAENPLAVGGTLAAQLLLPASREPVSVQARVMWVRTTARGRIGLADVGVAFEAIDAKARQAVEAAVAHFVRLQQRGPAA